MPHITANYKMYLPAGHHRQPRNANISLDLAPSSGGDTPYSPPWLPQLPYTLPAGGGAGMAKLLFWSDTDGTTGIIRPPVAFDIPSSATARTVTGWYYPISGPATGGQPGTAIIDDAFSAAQGRFIDDTFVDVTSDPSLTPNANVIGIVPTSSAQTLVAHAGVGSTSEPFSQWIFNDQIGVVGNATLQVPQGSEGIAIAVYQKGEFRRPDLTHDAIWTWVSRGVMVDGGGPTGGGPVDPWGPLIARLATSGVIATLGGSLDRKVSAQMTALAAQDALGAIRISLPQLEKLAGKGK